MTAILELVRLYLLRPIRSDAELAARSSMPRRLSTEEEDHKLVLADLIGRFESDNDPEPIVPHAEMLRALIDAKAITQAKLAADLGNSDSTISEILGGKRGAASGTGSGSPSISVSIRAFSHE